MAEQYTSIILTEAEMATLDDGQEWYKPGDTVYLGGYVGKALDLQVEHYSEVTDETFTNTADNWMEWSDLDKFAAIKARLLASAEPVHA